MKKFILPIAILLPVIVIGLVYVLWLAPGKGKKAAHTATTEKKKVNLVVSEKSAEKDSLRSFGDESGEKRPNLLNDSRPIKASKAKVDKYVESSGIANEFYELDAMLDKQIEQMVASSELSEAEKEKLSKIFVDHIKGDDLLETYKEAIAKEFTDEEIDKLLEIQNDPVVKRVTEEAQMKGDPEQVREQVEDFFKELDKNPVSKERENIVLKIAKSGKNAEFLADVTLGMVQNLGKHLAPEGQQPSAEELQGFKQQITEEAFGNVMSATMYQTRNLSDSELEHYRAQKASDLASREDAIRKGVAIDKTGHLFKKLGEGIGESGESGESEG